MRRLLDIPIGLLVEDSHHGFSRQFVSLRVSEARSVRCLAIDRFEAHRALVQLELFVLFFEPVAHFRDQLVILQLDLKALRLLRLCDG